MSEFFMWICIFAGGIAVAFAGGLAGLMFFDWLTDD